MSQSTEKSLGQVLYEAFAAGSFSFRKRDWASLAPQAQADFEREAQAVAAVERERIAAWVEPQRNDVPATGEEFAAAIRSMK